MPVLNFNVIHPPTSTEVQGAVLQALGENATLSMTIISSEKSVPAPEQQDITFRIRHTAHPIEGGMIIDGYTKDRQYVSVMAGPDLDQPAIGHVMTN